MALSTARLSLHARLPISTLAFLLLFSACARLPGPPSASRYKLFVSADGMHRLTGDALQSAGVPLERIDIETLQLFCGDVEVAIRVQGTGKSLVLDFYGQSCNSPFSRYNVYWLRWDVEKGKRMREVDAMPHAQSPRHSFVETIHLAEPRLYIPQAAESGAPWFWQSLTAPMTTTIAIALPGAIVADGCIKLNLWGSTQDAANPDHHLRVYVNDKRVADEVWDGMGAHEIDAPVVASAIREGENSIRLIAPGDTKAMADVILLRSLEVAYSRRFIAKDDSLQFAGETGTYRVEGFSSDAIQVFDITDPLALAYGANTAVAAKSVAFGVSRDARRWLVVGPSAYKTIDRLAPMSTANLRSADKSADYVLIAHPDLVAALQPLVQWREKSDLKTMVVTTQEIYDEYANGAESPQAIRAFLESRSPRFVLLVGKASYDYHDNLSGGNKNLVPTFQILTPHLGQAASDDWFVAASATDVRPRIALGRIPAKTPEQLTRIVNKIVAYESAPRGADWTRRAVLVADDKESIFTSMADEMAAKLPRGFQAQKIYLAAHKGEVLAARSEIIARWNGGASFIAYIGHGSIDTWVEGPLFSSDHLAELKNNGALPVLVAATCLTGFFCHPIKDSLAEELLFAKGDGIIAALAPTGFSIPEAQQSLMQSLMDELFGAEPAATLGEAILRAKQKMNVDFSDAREVSQTFLLLGDPALVLQFGK